MKHKQQQDRNCFICGPTNPIGLSLEFFFDDEENCSVTEFVIPDLYIGYDGIFHGGVIAAVFDDVMYYAIKQESPHVMTVNINVTYRAPAFVGHSVQAKGYVTGRRGRVSEARATLTDGGVLLAEATGKFVAVPPEKIYGVV